MSPDYWQKIKSILDEALAQPSVERGEYLAAACGANQTLRRDVESLLAFEHTDGDALEATAFAMVEDLQIQPNGYIGKTFGNYKVLEKIGEGGMGAVFSAERDDGEFRRKVAVKVIRSGISSDAVLRRFLNERQILAELEHPNIARLIDGGTSPDGVPYLAMEYVEGVPIDDYASANDLSLTERLDLFRRVCQAVSHAHKNLVIHRDLKPSNILVAADGTPKLLDFGIAKLLKDDANDTQTRQFAFTPDYASPEQVRGEKLTTATDVYSLGVILYELLTGSRPYQTDSQNVGEVVRIVCETEPERPSSVVSRPSFVDDDDTNRNKGQTAHGKPKTQNQRPKTEIQRALRGDLDNIILKALRKEPERRYSSVEKFSEDIRRHLAGLPVTASADTWTYRAAKFAQRNRVGVAAAGLILLTLLGGLAATLYQANAARREKAKAEQNYNDVRQLANSFLFEFHDEISSLPGATPARELVVKRALEYLDKLSKAGASEDAGLQRELASAYERVGKIQGNSYFSNLGDSSGAMQSYRRSLEIRQRLNAADPNNREIQNELAASYEGVGDMFSTDEDLPNALRNYEQALAIRLPLMEAEPDNLKYARSLSELHARAGDVKGMEGLPNLGDTPGAIEQYTRAVRVAEKLLAADPSDDDSQSVLGLRLQSLTMLQSAVGKSKDALESGRKVAAMFETLVARDPENAPLHRNLMLALIILRYPLLDEGLTKEAETNARRVVADMEKAAADDPKNANVRRSLSVSYNSLGKCLLQTGDAAGAIANHQRSLQIVKELHAADQTGKQFRRDVSLTEQFLAEAQSAAGERDAALANFRQAVSSLETQAQADDSNTQIKDDLAACLVEIGKILAAKNDLTNAADHLRRAVPLAEAAHRKSPFNARIKARYAAALLEAGKTSARLAQAESSETTKNESCNYLKRSFDIWNEMRQTETLSTVQASRPDEVSRELSGCQ